MLTLSSALAAYFLFVAGLLGLVLGSFCNAWAWRLCHGQSIAKGRSHCPHCGHTLGGGDLIPLVSYLCLRGRCRYCKAPISPRYPLAEALCAAYFITVLWRLDVSLPLLRLLPLGCLLLVAGLTDWETCEIPNRITAAGALLFVLRYWEQGWAGIANGLWGGLLLGLPLLLFVLAADKLVGRETMGGGDIKLFAMLGLHFGPALGLLLLIGACVFGLLLALVAKRIGKSQGGAIPLGPAIGLSTWFVVIWGPAFVAWYLSLFQVLPR